MKPVGIIGGMNPWASLALMQTVHAAVPLQDIAAHVPMIVHHNPQIPPRAQDPARTGADPMPVLMAMAQDLERAGAHALAMPSITAHQYALAITHATTLPFLDMVELTADRLAARGAHRVGVIAPLSVRETGILEDAIAARGMRAIWGKKDAAAGSAVQVATLVNGGADHLLVADMLLDPEIDGFASGIKATNSLDCLADAIVAFATASDRRLEKTA